MKVVQIFNKLVHSEFNKWGSIAEIPEGTFPQKLIDELVEAPDYVFIGWGYNNGEFIKPTPPKDFAYDDNTGTFYPVGAEPLKRIQLQNYPKLTKAVDNNIITKGLFAEITGEEYIEYELEV